MHSVLRDRLCAAGSTILYLTALVAAGCQSSPPPRPADDHAPPGPGPDLAILDSASPDLRRKPDAPPGPPYPIVLVHGFFGFKKIGPIEYFHHVKAALEAAGHRVFTPTVNPFSSSLIRGEELLLRVRGILEETGAGKVNFIAHSQGGVDARYVAAKIPERIGAVVTVATPHLGCKVADVLLSKAPGFSLALLQDVCSLAGVPFWGDVAKDPDLKAALDAMSSKEMEAFNATHPDVEGVRYFSIGGRSNLQLAKDECLAPKAPPFITRLADERDPTDPTLLLTAAVLSGSLLHPSPNDGMVNVSSTKWGTWLGCIPADHMDEVGQFFGDSPGLGNSFDHIVFYRELCAWLVAGGF